MLDPIHRHHPDPGARSYRPDPTRAYPPAPPRADGPCPVDLDHSNVGRELSAADRKQERRRKKAERKARIRRDRARVKQRDRDAYLYRDVLRGPYSQLDTDPYAPEPHPTPIPRRFDPDRDGHVGQHKKRILLGSRYEPVDMTRIYERDRYTCHICQQYIARYPSIDHVVPLTLGGDHVPYNLRVAHAECNSAKGGDAASVDIRSLLPPPPEFYREATP